MADDVMSGEGGGGQPYPAVDSGFSVNLEVYSGPFDALLGMLANRKLELTEVSLSSITEEFLQYIKTLDFARSMGEVSAFLDVASILVEAKSAALLPGDEEGNHDEQSMEALRERDLLFARLLQYKAFKQAGADFRVRLAANAGRFAHPGYMDSAIATMLPELAWTLGPQELARIAAQVIANAPATEVSVHQLHVPLVDLKMQAALVQDRLKAQHGNAITFAEVVADASTRIEVVGRFMALLVFFKQGVVQFKQSGPFEPLYLRWVADAEGQADVAGLISEGDFA